MLKYSHWKAYFGFPGDLNSSIKTIDGICSAGKNVFGMMPHPERAAHKELFNTDGRAFFEGIVAEVFV